jgi:hypothetical protein
MLTTTAAGQLSGECTLWRDTLRTFKTKFLKNKTLLMGIAPQQSFKDVLVEIEHLDNQFHIQLINIHDLKHAIKRHMDRITHERSSGDGHISDDVMARHEYLYDEYQSLETTLHVILREFDGFIAHLRSN